MDWPPNTHFQMALRVIAAGYLLVIGVYQARGSGIQVSHKGPYDGSGMVAGARRPTRARMD